MTDLGSTTGPRESGRAEPDPRIGPGTGQAPPTAPPGPAQPGFQPAPGAPGATPQGPAGEPTAVQPAQQRDWAREDLRDSESDVSAGAPARHASTAEQDHFFDRDQRMTVGEPEIEVRRARVSWLAVIGLLFGTVGVLAALTGDLAPIAVAAGVLGLLFSIGGFVATGKTHLASRPLALLAIVVSVGALALAAMVYSGQFDWLTRDDQAGWLRQWLDAHVPGMDSF